MTEFYDQVHQYISKHFSEMVQHATKAHQDKIDFQLSSKDQIIILYPDLPCIYLEVHQDNQINIVISRKADSPAELVFDVHFKYDQKSNVLYALATDLEMHQEWMGLSAFQQVTDLLHLIIAGLFDHIK